MTNKYLEKVALNILKARTMAKQVGVIPDHTSAWKHALRNLRNGRGEPLQGKALAEGRAKLGDISNNSFQKIKSVSHKEGGHQGYEFSTRVNSKGKLDAQIHRGGKGFVDRDENIVTSRPSNVHTHPGNDLHPTLKKEFDKFPHRHAQPSGVASLERAKDKWGTGKVKQIINNFRGGVTEYNQGVRQGRKQLANHKMLEATQTQKKIEPVGKYINDVAEKVKGPGSFVDGDAKGLVLKNMFKQDNHMERIVAPHTSTVSVNKSRGDGIRTLYFDHTPRKAK